MAQPEKTFRFGLVSASVFVNEVETGDSKRKTTRERRNVVLQRSYKDKDSDEWKQSTSFGLADLPVAIHVMELALRYVEEKEADVTG